MTEKAPEALKWLGSRVAPDLDGVLSGIVGDKAHTRGYHRGRNYVSKTDYSAQLPEDKKGDGEDASAIDMSFDEAKMKLYTGRLKAAAERNDSRMRYVREFYGTLDGKTVFGLIHDGSNDKTWRRSTSDKSHLWHVHISVLREYANNMNVIQGILDVLLGKPEPKPSTEEFVMATRDEVKAALREVILEIQPFQGAATRKRMTEKGWGDQSLRTLLEYIFESTTVGGIRSGVANDLAGAEQRLSAKVDEVGGVVTEKLAAQAPAEVAALLKSVLGPKAEAVFRAGLGQ